MPERKLTPIKKITVSDVMGKKTEKPDAATHLFTVYGAASSAYIKGTQYNQAQWVIQGRFEVVRNDGEEFSSLICYLPEPYQTQIAERLQVNKETGEVPQPVEFAFLIGVSPSKRGSLGYTYTCEPMTDTKEQDACASVRALIASKIPKALPAPAAKGK